MSSKDDDLRNWASNSSRGRETSFTLRSAVRLLYLLTVMPYEFEQNTIQGLKFKKNAA